MIVVITDNAEEDLERIDDYIAQFNPARAVTFTEELLDRCLLLSSYPARFSLLMGHEATGLRRIPHGKYVVYYQVGQRVEIVRILSAAQDHEAILFPEEPD